MLGANPIGSGSKLTVACDFFSAGGGAAAAASSTSIAVEGGGGLPNTGELDLDLVLPRRVKPGGPAGTGAGTVDGVEGLTCLSTSAYRPEALATFGGLLGLPLAGLRPGKAARSFTSKVAFSLEGSCVVEVSKGWACASGSFGCWCWGKRAN